MEIKLAERGKCTACGLCKSVCSKQCISFDKINCGTVYPVINTEVCIQCGACVKNCPALSTEKIHSNYPMRVYVAKNKDEQKKKNAASGGVASGFYKYAIENHWYVTGALFTEPTVLKMIISNNESDCKHFANSKYVFCEVEVYKGVVGLLKQGKNVLFIGLPCQVAAMCFYAERNNVRDHLLALDLICHGVANQKYLEDHAETIEKKKKRKIDRIAFRDSDFETQRFFMTFTDEKGKKFYKKRVKSSDSYQVGYHNALIYRDNCYSCAYAKRERVSDLTLGDFSGVGTKMPYSGDRTNISCVMVNTDKGMQFWNTVSNEFEYEERPIEEAVEVEKQLNHPSVKPKEYELFLKAYAESQDFDQAMESVYKRYLNDGKRYEFFRVYEIKDFLRPFLRRTR